MWTAVRWVANVASSIISPESRFDLVICHGVLRHTRRLPAFIEYFFQAEYRLIVPHEIADGLVEHDSRSVSIHTTTAI